MRIYLTHCSAKKDDSLKCTGKKVTPDILYTGDRIQGFMKECKKKGVKWAIFSDLYGVCCPNDKLQWYDKHPDKVTDSEFEKLKKNFNEKLRNYREIYFYHHPRRFHCLYRILLRETKLRKRITLFTHLKEIT